MAVGFAPTTANAILDALCRGVAWTQPSQVWVKLHVGDPGVAGTSNPAGNTTRKQATFGSAASGGAIANTVALTWSGVSNSETYSRFSVWDASVAGTFLFSGTVTASAVTAGDDFTAAIGAFTASLAVAS